MTKLEKMALQEFLENTREQLILNCDRLDSSKESYINGYVSGYQTACDLIASVVEKVAEHD